MEDEIAGNTIPRKPLNEAAKVQEVVKACGVGEYRAIALLGEHGGDVAATITFYKDLMEPILPKVSPATGELPPTPPNDEETASPETLSHASGRPDVVKADNDGGTSETEFPDRGVPGAYPQQAGAGDKLADNQKNDKDGKDGKNEDGIPEGGDSEDEVRETDRTSQAAGIGLDELAEVEGAADENEDAEGTMIAPAQSSIPIQKDGEVVSSEALEEWSFVLPKIPSPGELIGGGRDGGDYFSMRDVVGAIQDRMSFEIIQRYFGFYDRKMVSRRINDSVEDVPAMFFVVASNHESLLRMWVSYGGDVNATYGPTEIPLVAFAIINSDIIQNDTTLVVATLLSLGTKCTTIPKAFYSPFCEDMPRDGPDIGVLPDIEDNNKRWCTPTVRSWLARTLNLSQRYYLEKSLRTKKTSIRQKQVALRRNAEGLLGIHYFLIGQTLAAKQLMQKLISYMILPSKRPLVLVFAGPSGHGKTELARQLGHLLSLELQVVDCTVYRKEIELFGGRSPYTGSERGTPLNNFLVRKAGQKCVVFLDEFEKTTDEIHNALLIPFDKGEYQDRRDNQMVDCSKTLWILATNILDPIIMEFCRKNEKAVFIDDNMDNLASLVKTLGKDLKAGFKGETSAPLTGRITSFIPFLPFTVAEQSVVAHKYILELAHRIRAPVNLSPSPEERLLGNVYLKVRRDASVCKALANEGYDRDLGARSLINTVKTEVEMAVVESYLEVDREIEEGQRTEEFVADYHNMTVEVTRVQKAEQ